MIEELRAENLLLIERAELRLDPRLNVITGETGAGKTLLAAQVAVTTGSLSVAGSIAFPAAAQTAPANAVVSVTTGRGAAIGMGSSFAGKADPTLRLGRSATSLGACGPGRGLAAARVEG